MACAGCQPSVAQLLLPACVSDSNTAGAGPAGVEASDSEAELNSDEEKHGRAAPPAPTDRRASTHASQAGRKRKLPHEELPHAEPDSGADHGSDGSSDDDDRAPAGTGRGSAALKAEASAHRAQLEALKQQDPEFYAYLQVRRGRRGPRTGRSRMAQGVGALQPGADLPSVRCIVQSTDRELLDFGKHSESEDELEGFDDEGAESAEEGEPAGGRMTSSAQRGGVTLAMVEGWCQAARDKASMGATRNIIKVRQFMAYAWCLSGLPIVHWLGWARCGKADGPTGGARCHAARSLSSGLSRRVPLRRQRGAGGGEHARGEQRGLQQAHAVCAGGPSRRARACTPCTAPGARARLAPFGRHLTHVLCPCSARWTASSAASCWTAPVPSSSSSC